MTYLEGSLEAWADHGEVGLCGSRGITSRREIEKRGHRLTGSLRRARPQRAPARLDLALLAAHMRAGESHTALVKQYRAALGRAG